MFYGKYELTTSNFPFFFCMWMWFLKILPLLEKLLMGLKRPRLGCRYTTYGSTRPESLKKTCGVGASYLRNYDGVFSKLDVRGRPFNSCRKKKIACSTNVIESLWEKKGKKYPAHHIARKKNSWWPEITHPHPQELNGRPLNITC